MNIEGINLPNSNKMSTLRSYDNMDDDLWQGEK